MPPDSLDLSSDRVWGFLFEDLDKGDTSFIWAGPPCNTWSRVRTGPPGPRPLRTKDNIYGLKPPIISPEEAALAATGTYFALQTATLLKAAYSRGVPWGLEGPNPRGNPISMFNLPEYQALARLPGVRIVDFDQCMFGAASAKPTRVLYFRCDLSNLQRKCNHAASMWDYTDWNGNLTRVRSPHMPLRGRKDSSGNFATKAAAAYPPEMGSVIAAAIASSSVGPPQTTPS